MPKILARSFLILLGLAVVEFGFRGYERATGADGRGQLDELLERTEGWKAPEVSNSPDGAPPAGASTDNVLDPFLGFSTERLTWRLAAQADQFEDETFELVILGGSLAVGTASMAYDQIVAALEPSPQVAGREVRVINLARGSFKQPQQLHLFSQALTHGWRPDAVVNLDGFNEVAIGTQNSVDYQVHPFWPGFAFHGPLTKGLIAGPELLNAAFAMELERERVRALVGPRPLGLHRSAVATALAIPRARSAVGRFEAARDRYLELVQKRASSKESPPFDPGYPDALRLSVRNWAESSRSLNAICTARGIFYLHVLQPTLNDTGSKPLTPEEIEFAKLGPESWIRGAREGYPLLREAGAQLTADGVPFYDATGLFADERRSVYYDICHFGGWAQFALGQRIAEELVERMP